MRRMGVLVLVVGASGVGKDTLLNGARAILGGNPNFEFVRRVVTRFNMPGDEDHIVMDRETFAVSRTSGAFCLAWEAHGLGYGVPHNVLDSVSAGRIVVVNASRRVVTDAEALGVPIAVAHVTASAEKIAQRLSARGREDHAEIAARLARNAPLLVKTARLLEIRNDRAIAAGVTALVDALRCISQQDHSAV